MGSDESDMRVSSIFAGLIGLYRYAKVVSIRS